MKQKQIGFLLLLVFSLLLRIFFLFVRQDMWHDASFTVLFSQKPLPYILSGNDTHPPLYYLVIKLFLFLSTNEFFLRSTSILFWILFFIAVGKLSGEMFGKKATLFVLVLISISPTLIFYSLELRNYMMGMFFVVMQYLFFNRMKNATTKKNLLLFILFSCLMVYTHYYTVLIFLVEALLCVFYYKKNKELAINFLFSSVLVAIASSFLLFYLWMSLGKLQSFWFKKITLWSLISTLHYQFWLPETINISHFIFLPLVFIIALVSQRTKIKYELLMIFTIPVLFMWLVSHLIPIYHHRFFLFFSFALYMLFGGLFSEILNTENKKKAVGLCLIFILFIALSLSSVIKMKDTLPKEIYKSQKKLKQMIRTNDKVVFVHTSPFSQTPYKYYFMGYQNIKHLLRTDLTERERFTAGGSVISENEILTESRFISLTNYILVTDNKTFDIYKNKLGYNLDNIIFDDGGLVVYDGKKY